jgi:hypothetical protein
MSDNNDRRQFHRISFDAPLLISQGKHQSFSQLIDISMKGILVSANDFPLDITQPASISIHLADDANIDMSAEWVSDHHGAIAFRWLHMDIESMTHLRRLLELNTGNAELIERELALLSV